MDKLTEISVQTMTSRSAAKTLRSALEIACVMTAGMIAIAAPAAIALRIYGLD